MHQAGGGWATGIAATALLAGAGCASHAQLYEGPERPDAQVALIRLADEAAPDGLAQGMLLTGLFTAVDGRTVDAESVEVLPGPHDLCVLFGVEGLPPTEGRLELQAAAGGEYRVGLTADERGPVLILTDEATGQLLDDTRLAPDEASPVALDLSDEGWWVAHSANSCSDRGVTWLPVGQGFHDWTQQVNLYVHYLAEGDPSGLDAALAERRRRLEARGVSVETWTVSSRDETSASYRFRGEVRMGLGAGVRVGVGRVSLGLRRTLHCGYERRGDFAPGQAEDWLGRLQAAGGP